jgi:hypothetical protein
MKISNALICIAVTVAGLSEGAHAQSMTAPTVEGDRPWSHGVPVAERRAARDLFLEGNRLFRIPLFTRAAEKYVAALSKWKHPVFYFNLAVTQLSLGQDVEARDSLERALTHGAEPFEPAMFQAAQTQLHDLERKLGRIRVSCPTEGAEVTLDGAPLFIGPGSQQRWIKAGAHEVTAKKRNYLSEARRVTVGSAEIEDLELRLVTLSEATNTKRRWAVWKPWVAVAGGVAVAASAGLVHASAGRGFKAYDQEFAQLACASGPDSIGCPESEVPAPLRTQLERATRRQQFAVAGYALGGSLIATGAVLLYLNRARVMESGSGTSRAAGVTFAPVVSTDMLGAVVNVSH